VSVTIQARGAGPTKRPSYGADTDIYFALSFATRMAESALARAGGVRWWLPDTVDPSAQSGAIGEASERVL